ncbi:hypothetical protein [Xenorhabdus hominickii]|uniref:hypothetical protein n=1 Tax=Xenorhabdus hominickii TaxID=351679 RepID=UPI0011AB73AF|nr:hypothetical protein [Xenorhabdus hominickii]
MLSSNRDALPLLADIQYLEPYTSSALNRKLKGILRAGIYTGFQPKAGTGLSVLITSSSEQDGQGAASINVGKNQISIQQVKEVMVPVPASKTSIIALEANFEFGKVTNQVDSASTIKAAHIVVVDVSQGISGNQLELCRVNVPMDAKAITEAMIDTSHRLAQTVGITLSEKIDSDEEGIAANPKAVNRLRKTLLDNAPQGLNTIGQLATSLDGNKNFAETMNHALSGKMSKQEIASLDETGKFQHCLSSGFYKVEIKNIAAVADAPAGFYGYGILEVHNSNGVIAQRYTAHNGQVAVRQSWDNGTEWIGWNAVYSSTTKPTAAEVGAYSRAETDQHINDTRAQANAAQTAANNANNNANGRVPADRKVNGKPLSGDIALTAGEVGAYSKGETYSRGEIDGRVNDVRNVANNANNNANGRVPADRKVNGKPLSGDIALTAGEVGAYSKGETYSRGEIDGRVNDVRNVANNASNNANGRVPADRKVNGKPLAGDIALTAGEVGAYSKGETYSRSEIDGRVNDVRNVANNAQTAANNANHNANSRLEKSKNGADIPDKEAFLYNLGLAETRQQAQNAVPYGRRVNGQMLGGDVWLSAGDVGAYSKGEVESRINEAKNLVHNVVGDMRFSKPRVSYRSGGWNKGNTTTRQGGEFLIDIDFAGEGIGKDWDTKHFTTIQYFKNGIWVNINDNYRLRVIPHTYGIQEYIEK